MIELWNSFNYNMYSSSCSVLAVKRKSKFISLFLLRSQCVAYFAFSFFGKTFSSSKKFPEEPSIIAQQCHWEETCEKDNNEHWKRCVPKLHIIFTFQKFCNGLPYKVCMLLYSVLVPPISV